MFKCHICNLIFKFPKHYTNHYKYHANIPNIVYPCCIPNCNASWKTYRGLKTHYYRNHNLTTTKTSQLQCQEFNCIDCNSSFASLKLLISHLKSHLRSGVSIICPYYLCKKSFAKVQSFSSHLTRCHAFTPVNIIDNCRPCSSTPSDNVENCLPFSSAAPDNYNENYANSSFLDQNLELNEVPSILKDLSLFYMRLHTQYNIPTNVLQSIFDELNKFCSYNLTSTLNFLSSKLVNEVGLSVELSQSLVANALQENNFCKTQNLLKTDYKRKMFFKKEFGYIEPISVRLGYNDMNKMVFYHYIPILKSLSAFLQNESVLQQLNKNLSVKQGLLLDHKNGCTFQNHPFWKSQKLALQIILYQDSFEVVNPLGAAKNKHKMLAVYFSLGNLHVYNRSKVDALQLVLLCREKDYKTFGQTAVFSPLIRDLKILENVGLEVPGFDMIKGSVLFLLGDNLGSHNMGGFTENFSSSSHICRFCTMTQADFQKSLNILDSSKRTINSYDDAVKIIDTQNLDIYEGIKFNSILNSLSHYHVCDPGMPPCLGHDLFEGIIPYDLCLMMKYFIKTQKFFTYKLLNSKIKKFPFKDNDAVDKPGYFSQKNKLIGHAVQNWCLIRFITVIIDDLVSDKNDSVWKLLCNLQEITSIVCSKILSEGQVAYLKILISEYLVDRKELFPEVPLRPKHHYIAHYPSLILKYGPLIWLWTLRFESKHSFFKKAIRQASNFINVTLTMAEKHQLHQSYLQTGQYFSDVIEMKHATKFIDSELDQNILSAIKNCSIAHNMSDLTYSYSVKVHGTEIKINHVILIEYDFPIIKFGIIKLILLKESNIHLVIQHVLSEKLIDQYAFELKQDLYPFECIEYSLMTSFPMTVYNINQKRIVVPKHAFLT